MRRRSYASVGVEHDSELSTHGLWWKVSSELCSNSSIVSVSLDDSAPDHSEFGVSSCVLGLVDVSDSLSEVEGSILLVINSLDFKESELFILNTQASLEASEDSLGVESTRKSIS